MVETATRLMVLECRGTPRRIGEQHGEAARDLIARGLGQWGEALGRQLGEPIERYVERFLAETRFRPAMQRYGPALLEELRGVADGAGQPFEVMLAYNLMDEEWQYRTRRYPDLVTTEPAPGCTSLAVDGAAIAQTMDIPSYHDGTQAVLRIVPDDGMPQLVFTAGGMLALNGANAAGVGVVVNSLAQSPSSASGLPVMWVIRGVLAKRSAAEAAAYVESVPHAIGQHYLIGDTTEVLSLEAAANAVNRVNVTERYVHANHPLTDLERLEWADAQEAASNTHARQARAEVLMADAADQLGLEAVLADDQAPISCPRERRSMTFGGASIGLRQSPPRVRISPGPPHEAPWQDVSWA